MAWFMLYETATGRAVSLTTDLPQPLPLDMSATTGFQDNPLNATQMWDESSRAFVPRPAEVLVDRVDDFLADPEIVGRLTPAIETRIRTVLGRMLGEHRLRNQSDPVDL